MQLNFWFRFRPKLFLIPIFILSACAPAVPTNVALPTATETQLQSSPTAAEPTAVVQPTEPPIQPVSTEPPLQVQLAAVKFSAKVFSSEDIEMEVQQAQMVNVHMNDRIELVRLEERDEQSYSILNFPDLLQVELFGNTVVLLADINKGSEGPAEIALNLSQGHMFVELNDQTFTQVTVETPFSTIRTLENDTELDICHNEALTCVVVKRGVAEIIAQGKKEIVRAGAASYVLKDQAPSLSVCAPTVIFVEWEESFRRLANTSALDKKVFALPKTLCTSTSVEIPLNARKLYQDSFTNPTSGWDQGKIDNYMTGYSEQDYYQIQIQKANEKILVSEPQKTAYEDMNADIKVFTKLASSGDFRYGLLFRRLENRYYAFAISPRTKHWYFLKTSSDGTLETLKEGTEIGIQSLEAADVLRVEASGSTFYLYINGQFLDLVRDSDYARGEVGLFVQTIDSPDVLVHFDTITIWEMQASSPIPTPQAKENCFNNQDDDGDRSVDRADPDCQKQVRTATPVPPTSTDQPTIPPPPTDTPEPPYP